MQRIKSLFISIYVVFLVVATPYALWHYFQADKQLLFLSAFGVCAFPLGYLAYIYIRRPKSVETFLLVVTAATATLSLITIGDRFYNNAQYNEAVIIALSGLIGWLLYHMWYAKLNPKHKIEIGQKMPDATLFTDESNSINVSNIPGKYRLLVFHRGNWCPFCVAEVENLDKQLALTKKHGLTTIAISPVSPRWNNRLVKRINEDVYMLMDKDNSFAKRIGIFHQGNLPFGLQILGFGSSSAYPTSILIDENNKIAHIHQAKDYRKRPELDFWLRIIEHASAKK